MSRSYLSTRDLVTIAVLSALGGVMSAYVGYLANLFNSLVGTPFGAGQFLAGLHVFWLLLARGATGKVGSGTLAGFLKGVVEMLAGSVHGVVIVIVSLVEGFVVDVLTLRLGAGNKLGYMVAGGFATASNVFIFQLVFLSGVPLSFILVIGLMAFASGVIFAGYFSHTVLVSLEGSGILPAPGPAQPSKRTTALGYLLVGAFLVGSIWYYTSVYTWGDGGEFQVGGLVTHGFDYRPQDFASEQITVLAELRGSYMYVGPRNYTGVPLAVIIDRAEPTVGASVARLVAEDGYSVDLSLDTIRADRSIIIVTAKGESRLVADGLDGSLWVRAIVLIELV